MTIRIEKAPAKYCVLRKGKDGFKEKHWVRGRTSARQLAESLAKKGERIEEGEIYDIHKT
jgi:hypothetical protein